MQVAAQIGNAASLAPAQAHAGLSALPRLQRRARSCQLWIRTRKINVSMCRLAEAPTAVGERTHIPNRNEIASNQATRYMHAARSTL
jgi:hypothetical protein